MSIADKIKKAWRERRWFLIVIGVLALVAILSIATQTYGG